jgi:hypothetical protein
MGELQAPTAQQVSIPEGCPDPSICKFKDEPEPGPHGDLDKADENMCATARTQAPTQQRGTVAEVRAMRHNRKNAPKVKDGKDVECKWECTVCHRKFEIDQVVREDNGDIVGIVEVKSGAPLRGPQSAIHNVLAQQKGIRSIKKVQHKKAIEKCKKHTIDHVDITPEPSVVL